MNEREGTLVEIVDTTTLQCNRVRVLERVQAALVPLRDGARRCRVAFIDDNGPKGGVAIRCTIDVRISHWPAIHVEGVAISQQLALHLALNRLKRRINHALAASRATSRHPKKYFVAARMLAGGPREARPA
jgi:hypothetical protein